MDINKHQVYSHWLNELSAISDQEFFPTFRQFLNLLDIENPEKISKLEEEYENEYTQLNKLGEEAVNEIEPLFNRIEEETRKAQLPLSIDAVRYKQIKKGEVLTSESLPDALYHAIRTTLESCKHTEKLKMFDNLMSERNGFWYLDYDKAAEVFPIYRNYQIESRKYEEKEKEEVWGLYNSLKGYATFFKEIFPEEAGIMTKKEIINKLKRLVLYLLTPEGKDIKSTKLHVDDTAIRRVSEQKWDILQSIWEIYEAHSRADCIVVPVARLTVKDSKVDMIDEVIEGFREEGLFKNWERKDRWYNLEFIDHEMLPARHEEMRKVENPLTSVTQDFNKSLTCNWLKLDLDQSVIQYKDNPSLEISTGINIIKMLVLLMQNRRVVEYKEIAQKLLLNCYHEGVSNRDVAREVQFLRRDLKNFLLKIGMSKSEIRDMIISKKNVGYKLRFGD